MNWMYVVVEKKEEQIDKAIYLKVKGENLNLPDFLELDQETLLFQFEVVDPTMPCKFEYSLI